MEAKLKKLSESLNIITKNDTAVAFSGGVDSALILNMTTEYARKNGTKVYAITADSELLPVSDMEEVGREAAECGATHLMINMNVIKEAGIENNPKERCYLCKHYLFSQMKKEMEKYGVSTLLDGTNADDLKVYRPGIKALKELEVISPLADCGFTKEEVRRLAKQSGLKAQDKPSMPCMATRFEYGTRLNEEDIKRLSFQEDEIRKMGFYNLRIRIHEDFIRIETDIKDFPKVYENREKILDLLKDWNKDYITLDMEGFKSGSMDKKINNLMTS